jgi:hypothetical protein
MKPSLGSSFQYMADAIALLKIGLSLYIKHVGKRTIVTLRYWANIAGIKKNLFWWHVGVIDGVRLSGVGMGS